MKRGRKHKEIGKQVSFFEEKYTGKKKIGWKGGGGEGG
jgi:hypothetical protein